MEYRNSGAATHHGKGFVTGVDGNSGVEIVDNAIQPASDSNNANLILRGKGTGGVTIGAGTLAMTGFGVGSAVTPAVALPVSGLVYSTLTVPGLALGDVLLVSRPVGGMSTALGMVGAWASAANEGTYAVINNQASTQSLASTCLIPYVYFRG